MTSRHLLPLAAVALFALIPSLFSEQVNIADDDANQSAYAVGWESGKNGGEGFGPWTLTTEGNDENRHSGFFIATTENNSDLNGIASKGKAFGLFANGESFEQAVAFRPFTKPLAVGDSFSFSLEHGAIEKKFEKDDPAGGSIGLVLRAGNEASGVGDYNKGAIFEFGFYKGKDNYQVIDGSPNSDTGVLWTDAGVSVTCTITGKETYDLEIVTLKDKKITKLPGRKIKGDPIASFAIFDRNGEQYDAFFNSFQVSREAK